MKVKTRAETWTVFLDSLIETKKKWEVHRLGCQMKVPIGEGLSVRSQRPLVQIFNKMKFSNAIPVLIKYAKGSGGIEGLQLTKEEKTKTLGGSNIDRPLVEEKKRR